ncbi:MAG: hypothetical protein Q9217_001023 [Psora testacea]
MRILLLGASGRTGAHVLTEAFTRSHTVTALVRRPEALTPHKSLIIRAGTPLNKSDIESAFVSAPPSDPVRAVISTLNNGRTSDSPFAKTTAPPDFLAQTVKNVLEAMERHDCKKIIVLGTNGVGSSRAHCSWIFNFIVDHSNLKITFDDHFEVQKLLEEEGKRDKSFKWVDVRATGLNNSRKRPVKEFGEDGKGAGWFIGRESVAAFMLEALDRNDWDGRTPVISN